MATDENKATQNYDGGHYRAQKYCYILNTQNNDSSHHIFDTIGHQKRFRKCDNNKHHLYERCDQKTFSFKSTHQAEVHHIVQTKIKS